MALLSPKHKQESLSSQSSKLQKKEDKKLAIEELAMESWKQHLEKNKSIIVDLF